MPRQSSTLLAVILAAVTLTGCASTTVHKSPGPDDCGFRFYRAKPYLLLTPADAGKSHTYTLSITNLPDFTEEYSVHVNPGIGINNTELKFNDAGVLTGAITNIDSGVTPFIQAVTGLAGTVGGLAEKRNDADKANLPKFEVKAFNVPIGLYEAVLGRGPDGTKRLYGWRYVGFTPFAPCPLESSGAACTTCTEMDLYGLVWMGDAMVFARLSDIAGDQVGVKASAPKGAVSPTAPGTPAPDIKPLPILNGSGTRQ